MIKPLRKEVVKTAALLVDNGLMPPKTGNISIHNGEGLIAITPSGYDYTKMKAHDVSVIDLDGQVLRGWLPPSSEWRMHLELYRRLPGVRAIVHTHSPYATHFACLGKKIPLQYIEEDPTLSVSIPVSPYVLRATNELGAKAAETLQERPGCLLEKHGVLAVGDNIRNAYENAHYIEKAAQAFYTATGETNELLRGNECKTSD